jgi:hypothetical protein
MLRDVLGSIPAAQVSSDRAPRLTPALTSSANMVAPSPTRSPQVETASKGPQILENRARPPSPSPGATEQTTPRHASDLHRRAIADKFFNLLKFLHNQLNQCLSGTVSICLTEQLPLAIENLLFQR